MGGLARLCKAYGGMKINGESWVWDYVADTAVPEREMPHGSERRKASERKRYAALRATLSGTEGETR